MKFKVLLSLLLIVALICPAILAEEAIESPIMTSEGTDPIISGITEIEKDTVQDETTAAIVEDSDRGPVFHRSEFHHGRQYQVRGKKEDEGHSHAFEEDDLLC